MKKKIFIPIIVIALILILFTPIPRSPYKDGGTREYVALTYKIVKWNKLIDTNQTFSTYSDTNLYLFPNNFKNINRLWDEEEAKALSIINNHKPLAYTETWLDKDKAEKFDNSPFGDIIISEIYSNCFFANTVIPMPYQIKLNGSLSDAWCVGDQILATCNNIYYDKENQRIEADFTDIKVSTFQPDPLVAYKPVIYLYPKVPTNVDVNLFLNGGLTCTYPKYENGWQVKAYPDGRLTDKKGQSYNYLYWEGNVNTEYDFKEGFCVKGEDTALFLEDALEKLGLNRKEANEFIVYWLPIMENNPYNIISFQTDAYTDAARLDIKPKPDTLIRVFMTFKASNEPIEIEKQELSAPRREGFTVIEWGGSEIK